MLLLDGMLSLGVMFIWPEVQFKYNVSLLNFCLYDLFIAESHVLKFPTNIELLYYNLSLQIC
jgi:hypothetical protein